LKNNGDGTFSDVSARSGTDDSSWSVSASFVDIDRDGWLDLFVGNYLRYSLDTDKPCAGWAGEGDYCAPQSYPAQPSRLYRNQRDGTFADVTASALAGGDFGPALGVSTADFDGDGWVDIYVANDGQENQLWINRRNGTFRNAALLAGVALNGNGRAEASMGVDAADIDDDGDEDLVIANLTLEGMTLYLNDGTGVFEDYGAASGLRLASLEYTGFGAAWFDFDNDGVLDVMTVNGAVRMLQGLAREGDAAPFHQRKQLFRGLGGRRFADVTDSAGQVFQFSEVGRGAAFGDMDNDGDTDVLVANNDGPARLLLNQVGNKQHWLGLRLVAGTPARDMVGAKVGVVRSDGTIMWRRVRADGSYASASDPRVLVGLGGMPNPRSLRIVWPDGTIEERPVPPFDRWTSITKGSPR
jgi:hypothetical protein